MQITAHRKTLVLNMCTALLLMLMLLGQAQAESYSRVVVLGDSFSDSGNIYLATGMNTPSSPPYYMGRFSNGPNYADQLAENLGLMLVPSLAGGTNFAFGAARTDFHPSGQPFDIQSQTQALLASGIPLDDETLVVLFGGGNNLRDGIFQAAQDPANAAQISAQTVQNAVEDLILILTQLQTAGADEILLLNMANLAALPEIQQFKNQVPGIEILAENISVMFNEALKEGLKSLDRKEIIRFNSFKTLEKIVRKPQKYGLRNVTESCYTGDPESPVANGTVCANPDQYLFWDSIHMTSAGYHIFAQAILKKLDVDEDQHE